MKTKIRVTINHCVFQSQTIVSFLNKLFFFARARAYPQVSLRENCHVVHLPVGDKTKSKNDPVESNVLGLTWRSLTLSLMIESKLLKRSTALVIENLPFSRG